MLKLIRKFQISLPLCLMMIAQVSLEVAAAQTPPVVREHATVNGLKIYHEIHGATASPDQVPLLLIHGGGSSIDVTWSKAIPIFSKQRKVIAFDEQAHGKSDDRKTAVSFTQTADDAAALLAHLRIAKVDVAGFSNGASSAMQLAIRHPEKIRKLVFISSFTKKSGAQPGFFDSMKNSTFKDMPQELKDAFLKINPDPAKLQNMYDRDSARMRNFPETTDKDVKALQMPTLLMAGDRDVVQVPHLLQLSKMIRNSRLLILPGGHGEFLEHAPAIALISQFLDDAQ